VLEWKSPDHCCLGVKGFGLSDNYQFDVPLHLFKAFFLPVIFNETGETAG
jgi:hypothetical protein